MSTDTKDTLATLAGCIVVGSSTFQTFLPEHTPWYVRAALATVASMCGVWTGVKAYKPVAPPAPSKQGT